MASGEDGTTDAAIQMLLRVGGPDLLLKMVDSFLKQVPQRIEAIRGGLAGGDLSAVHIAAHTLKSSAAQLGAEEMRGLCAEIEARAHAKEGDGIAALLGKLEAEAVGVRARLESEVERARSGA